LTEEKVKIPFDAIAFISIKARIKFQGLMNASGFHVDPGYEGRLIFSVFNAGPLPIHLRRGQDCFLIWYANLDRDEKHEIKKGFTQIDTGMLVPGAIPSFENLDKRLREIEVQQKYMAAVIAMLTVIIAALLKMHS
jgi:dCTP deaminase